jgi:Ner family transcriptional regulator
MRRDWHPEDIKAAIRKRGRTLSQLGARHGITRQVMANALIYPHAAAEVVIARFIGVPAHRIWPSRYNSNGERKKPQPTVNYKTRRRFGKSAVAA